MGRSDQWVIIHVLLLVVIHVTVGIVGFITGRILLFVTLLNFMAGSAVVIYWIQQQLRITQHFFEQRELFILLPETLLIACSVYFFIGNRPAGFIKAVQYTSFVIHLLLLLLGLVFMLTFKMNKLL